MNVLLTGSEGFIGSVLKETLEKRSHVKDIVTLDRKGTDSRYENEDISDRSVVETVFDDHSFDLVYHLAAEASVGESSEDRLFQDNVVGTYNMMKAAKDHSTPMVYTSSIAAQWTDSFYGATKNATEKLWQGMENTENILIVRPTNILGEGKDFGHVAAMIEQGIEDGRVEAWSRGTQVRSYVYVNDLCRWMAGRGAELVSEKGSPPEETFLEPVTWNRPNAEVAEIIATRLTEHGEDAVFEPTDDVPPAPTVMVADDHSRHVDTEEAFPAVIQRMVDHLV